MGKLYKRGNTWWGDYRTASNERVRESLRTSDREVARQRLRDAELGGGPSSEGNGSLVKPLGRAIEEMIATKRDETATSYRDHSIWLLVVLGAERDINSLKRVDVQGYIANRLAAGIKRHTIHKELVVLRQALKEARLRGEFTGSLEVVPSFKAEYEPRSRWLTPAEFARLLQAFPEARRTWLMVQVYTGAELAAMKRLEWSHVDLEHDVITIPGTKNSARFRARIPLHPELAAHLRRLDRNQPLLQPWPRVHEDMRIACASLTPPLVPGVTTHDLRRTFGSWLVQAGVDIHHVARLMGNTPAMVARVYGQTSDASYAAAINRLPKLTKTPKPNGRNRQSSKPSQIRHRT